MLVREIPWQSSPTCIHQWSLFKPTSIISHSLRTSPRSSFILCLHKRSSRACYLLQNLSLCPWYLCLTSSSGNNPSAGLQYHLDLLFNWSVLNGMLFNKAKSVVKRFPSGFVPPAYSLNNSVITVARSNHDSGVILTSWSAHVHHIIPKAYKTRHVKNLPKN